MAIVGSIIKGIIDLRDKLVSEPDAEQAQLEVLKNLLNKAKDTAFGKHYGFEEIVASEDIKKAFAEKVPYFDYNKLNEAWWSKLHQGQENITWPGKPPYFALSSGTTGSSSKRIPVTEEMLDTIRKTGIKQVGALSNFDLPSDFYEKEIMMLGSSTALQDEGDHKEGRLAELAPATFLSGFGDFINLEKKFRRLNNGMKGYSE